ncbi:MAG: hypothetical protein HPY84_04230 [Syntrophobacteraceae bacterium]|nr:hypothetical protein [Syntrophobacteraceae bacterium]
MPSTPVSFSESIQEKILEAHRIFRSWGNDLMGDRSIALLLQTLKGQILDSRKAMFDLGIVATCTHCDEEEGGSCCGAGIENRYNTVLLLMNLLLGVHLPAERLLPGGCFFLGRHGCVLEVRHILCINYLCLRIQREMPPDKMAALQDVTGREMDSVFTVHEAIKKFMRR